jgi:flap endonuclease-1
MGLPLTPIAVKTPIRLEDLRERSLAFDGNGELYQFLALIRLPDGTPLRDPSGRVTSHLSGLFYRTTRLIADYRVRPVFVFDGVPPPLKNREIARRRAVRARYDREADEARQAGDLARAYGKATMTSRLTREMIEEATTLLTALGIPVVQAPSEGEAQAASMAARGRVWAAVSKDYDTLLFGAPRLVRFVSISGREYLPASHTSRPITPELIDLDRMLHELAISRAQLVDLAILTGTDFNEGIRGIGPKKALKLVRDHGRLEDMPPAIAGGLLAEAPAIRDIYLDPEVADVGPLDPAPCDTDAVVSFLCEARAFGKARVMAALERAFGAA